MNAEASITLRDRTRPRDEPHCARMPRRIFAGLLFMVIAVIAGVAGAQAPPYITDGIDAVIRRTDLGNDGPFDEAAHGLPDLLRIRMGSFDPDEPWEDRFDGEWRTSGGFFRCDLVFAGLVNPPGPLGWDDLNPEYDPFRYGVSPVFGYIEFNMDEDEDTGGEIDAPQLRYTGNAARFGGTPSEPYLADRVARNSRDFDFDVTTSPFIERSGEEFHLAFLGERIDEIYVRHETPGGDPDVFEAGEVWDVEGELFHRAHGFEQFEFRCVATPGPYEPEVVLRFAHNPSTDETTISLVYPLRNSAAADLEGPEEPTESSDGCAGNQNSIFEALQALKFSATNADPFDRTLPEFQLIAGWEFNNLGTVLEVNRWRVLALVGSAYESAQVEGARFIWTDVYPNPIFGDFNGDAAVDQADQAELNAFVAANDADPLFDADGRTNGILEWPDFAVGFCGFDTDCDGFVGEDDGVVLGDLDLNGLLTVDDVDDFVLALLSPQDYSATHGGADPVSRGDFNVDARLDGIDVQYFVDAVLTSSP